MPIRGTRIGSGVAVGSAFAALGAKPVADGLVAVVAASMFRPVFREWLVTFVRFADVVAVRFLLGFLSVGFRPAFVVAGLVIRVIIELVRFVRCSSFCWNYSSNVDRCASL